MIYPANNLDDAYNACNPNKPLKDIDDQRYLDLASVRSPYSVNVLTKRRVKAVFISSYFQATEGRVNRLNYIV